MNRKWMVLGAGVALATGLGACSSKTPQEAKPVQAEAQAAEPADDFDAGNLMSQAKLVPYPREGQREGFLVERLEPKSNWAKVGLKPGDVIVAVGNKAIGETGTSLDLLRAVAKPGSELIEVVRRDTKRGTAERFPLPVSTPK